MPGMEYYDKAFQYIYEAACGDMEGAVEMAEYADYFMEAGEAKSGGFVQKIIDGIRKFFQRIASVINEFFNRKEIKSIDPKKAPGKVQISEKNQKLIDEGKVTLKTLQGCKTAEEVEKAMNKYRRKKAAIKAGTTVLVLSGVAAIGWLQHTRNKELQEYKKAQVALEKKAYEKEKELLEEKKRASKEAAELRQQVADAYAKANGLEKEAKRLKKETAAGTRKGNAQGVQVIVNANTEVIKDQAQATVAMGGEIVKALVSGKGVVEKAKGVASAVNGLSDATNAAQDKKVNNLESERNDLRQKGKKLKKAIDQCIKIINNPKAPKQKQNMAWALLKRWGPALGQVGGKYAVVETYYKSAKFKQTVKRIKDLNEIPDNV